MQTAIDDIFLNYRIPANDVVVEVESIHALVRAMAPFSNDQLDTLEDELNFYVFTNLMGSLMQEVLRAVPTAGASKKSLTSPIRNQSSVKQNDNTFLCAV